jgi:hypothetical protein
VRERHEFKITQGGIVVAGASSTDIKSLVRECCHYLFMYRQDGHCSVEGSAKFMAAFKHIRGSEEYTSSRADGG